MGRGGHLHHISSSLNFRTLNFGNLLEVWHYCSRENLLKCQRYGFKKLIKNNGFLWLKWLSTNVLSVLYNVPNLQWNLFFNQCGTWPSWVTLPLYLFYFGKNLGWTYFVWFDGEKVEKSLSVLKGILFYQELEKFLFLEFEMPLLTKDVNEKMWKEKHLQCLCDYVL